VPLRFVVVGANTMIGLAPIYLLKWLVGVGDTAANVGAYSLGLTASFLFNRNLDVLPPQRMATCACSISLSVLPTPLISARSLYSSGNLG
jgi:hypothetical protein